MPKIALIKVHNKYIDTYEDEVKVQIAEHITDWTEISDQDLQILKSDVYRYGYQIIEFPQNQEKIIQETVQQTLERIKKEKKKRQEEKDKYERNRIANAEKRKRKQLEKLKKEFGE